MASASETGLNVTVVGVVASSDPCIGRGWVLGAVLGRGVVTADSWGLWPPNVPSTSEPLRSFVRMILVGRNEGPDLGPDAGSRVD